MKSYQVAVSAMVAAAALSMAVMATAQEPPKDKPEKPPAEPMVDARAIWPAGLDRLAGRYTFVQVASPGGLWETVVDANGKTVKKHQVSLNEISPARRKALESAEISLALEEGPRRVQATQRVSPSRRGMLRFYEEEAFGKLTVRNLPGVQGGEEAFNFSGRAHVRLEHQSHSNPSISGILRAREQQEPTWGAATLDYADLVASTVPQEPEGEGQPVLTNARVLRSGTEIFAYVEWTDKDGAASRRVFGVVRLLRSQETQPIRNPATRALAPVLNPARG
jgi:hypothetical protein